MVVQRWELEDDAGRVHRVETEGSTRHLARWYVDDELVAERASLDAKITLRPADREELGSVVVRHTQLGAPRRATLFAAADADPAALAGIGGIELSPEPGSPAATYAARVLAHPTRYTLLRTAGGVAAVVVPIVLGALLVKLAFSLPLPDIPWPNLPSVPLPDLPDLPGIPWPDVTLPAWVREVLGYAKYVWPVLLAFLLARAEIRRRRAAQSPENDPDGPTLRK